MKSHFILAGRGEVTSPLVCLDRSSTSLNFFISFSNSKPMKVFLSFASMLTGYTSESAQPLVPQPPPPLLSHKCIQPSVIFPQNFCLSHTRKTSKILLAASPVDHYLDGACIYSFQTFQKYYLIPRSSLATGKLNKTSLSLLHSLPPDLDCVFLNNRSNIRCL